MSVEYACEFFKDNKKIMSHLNAVMEVGLYYISLGRSLSTFSGGERQRVKLAQNIKKKAILFTGTPKEMVEHANIITAKYLKRK